jgi:hypothetical protein
MQEVEKRDAPEIAGGESSTVTPIPAIEYPIETSTPEGPLRLLVIPETPLP